MKINGKSPKIKLSFFRNPMDLVYASEPFVLRALLYHYEEDMVLSNKFLGSMINVNSKNLLDIREKCILAWGGGKYEP